MKTISRSFILILIILVINSCDKKTENDLLEDNKIMSISYGTSFGECIGYCIHEIEVNSGEVNYLATSWNKNSNFPDISDSDEISAEKWKVLVDKIDFTRFKNLEEVIGCPDCADGGAEWIEIRTADSSHKITFEYQNEPEDVKAYIAELREFMNNFEKK